MSDQYGRKVSIPTAPNLRDLGGLPAGNRQVRRGVVYRSATLATLSDADRAQFAGLGIETVYDLRTADEVAASPDRLPEGTLSIELDVLADSSLSVAARLGDLSADPQGFAATLGDGKAERLFEETYRDIVRLPSALTSYRELYLGILDENREGAALFHCTTGKDRTGWAAASILTLLGVDEAVVYEDYLQTNTDLLPALEPVLQKAEAAGVDRDVLLPVLGVRENYLHAAFAQLNEQFGTIERYAQDGLGLTASDIERFRQLFAA